MLQRRGQLVDVARSDVHRHMVGQQRSPIAAHGIAPHLDQQRLHHVGIVFQRRQRTRSLSALPSESGSR